MVRGPHWQVPEDEVKPWSQQAADLLDRIPVSAMDRLIDASAVATVAVGVGGIVLPRLIVDKMVHAKQEPEPETEPVEDETQTVGNMGNPEDVLKRMAGWG